jgi:septum formation topological specificity factor MinE
MHYPRGVIVKGVYYAGRGANVPIGPEIVPGTYDVELSYNGHVQKQSFTVKLDPRRTTTQAELQQRFDLLMKIYDATNQLAATINKATDLRDRLEAAVAGKKQASAQAQTALAGLNKDINSVVDFRIQSSRGFDVFPPRLLAWLSAIYSRVGTAYVAPSQALTQVADEYLGDERQGVARLQSAINRANAALRH